MTPDKNHDNSCQASYLIIALATAIILVSSVKPAVAQNHRKVSPPREMVQQLIRDDEDIRSLVRGGGYTVAKLANEIEAESIDLNRDGQPEWVLVGSYQMGVCGATGNCTIWVYRKSGAGYQLLLKDTSNSGVGLKRTITNGFLDVALTQHSSALETYITTFKFDGQHYQSRDCVIRSYLDKNGRQLKRPILRKCS